MTLQWRADDKSHGPNSLMINEHDKLVQGSYTQSRRVDIAGGLSHAGKLPASLGPGLRPTFQV